MSTSFCVSSTVLCVVFAPSYLVYLSMYLVPGNRYFRFPLLFFFVSSVVSALLELRSRIGDNPLKFQVICPQLSPKRDCSPKRDIDTPVLRTYMKRMASFKHDFYLFSCPLLLLLLPLPLFLRAAHLLAYILSCVCADEWMNGRTDAAHGQRYLRLPGLRPHPGGRLQNCDGYARFRRVFHRGFQRGRSATSRPVNLFRGSHLRREFTGDWGGARTTRITAVEL